MSSSLRIELRRIPIFVNTWYIICCLACSIAVLPQISDARIGENLEYSSEEALKITARSLTYLADQRLFVADGNVEITYRSVRLTADYIEFHDETGDALAIGNVIYEEGTEVITAEQAEFNLESQLGTIQMGDLLLDDDQYFTGQEVMKTGEKTYTIKKGSFTACDSSWPAWKFRSSTAKIHEGEYLQSWNTVGYLKGIPIVYFPYFVFPIKTERQSGFLVPDIGNSTINGLKIRNAFFWAILPSQDATFSHTYYENRGHKYDLEYRYVYSDETDGTLTAEYLPQDEIENQRRRRMTWQHIQGFPYDIKGRVNLDLTDDDQFSKDFSEILDERSESKLQSTVSLTKNFSQHTLKLLVDRVMISVRRARIGQINGCRSLRFPVNSSRYSARRCIFHSKRRWPI